MVCQMLSTLIVLSFVGFISAYTIVLTEGNRSTEIEGMLLPLYTVELDEGEVLTEEEKVQAYNDWQTTTTNYLASIGNETTEAYRDAMFCYTGPALYPAATDTLPEVATCSDFIAVYNNSITETNEFLSEMKNATRKCELMASGEYDTILAELEEDLRILEGYFPGMSNSVVDELQEEVNELINEPTSDELIEEAVISVLGNTTNQTQIDQATLIFSQLLSENQTTFTQEDVDEAATSLFGTAGLALNDSTLAAITEYMQNTTWVNETREVLHPGDSFVDEIVMSCGNGTESKNFTAFLDSLIAEKSKGKYNSSAISPYLPKYFGKFCLEKVPGLPHRVYWWTATGTFLTDLLNVFTGRNATTIEQAKTSTNTVFKSVKNTNKEISNNVSTYVNNAVHTANKTVQTLVDSIVNLFKGFG